MKRSMLLVLALAALIVQPIAAQFAEYERILLPLARSRVQGAFGSDWLTDVAVTNMSDTPLRVTGYEQAGGCAFLCGSPPPIPPHATIFVTNTLRSNEVPGAYLWVERGRTADFAATLRVRDLSRQRETWGTAIPVVAPSDLFGTRFGLVDIPLDPQFRSLLRIYDADATTEGSVRIRVYAVDPARDFPRTNSADALLFEKTTTFRVATSGGGAMFLPGSIELPLWAEPALAGASRVRVEIEPLTETADFWAFVSITHNDTQHVTVITPQ